MEGKIPNGPGTVEKSNDWSETSSAEWNSRKRQAMLRGDPKSDYNDNVKPTMANRDSYIS